MSVLKTFCKHSQFRA